MNVWVGDTSDFIDLTWLRIRQDSEEEELLKGIHDFLCFCYFRNESITQDISAFSVCAEIFASGSKLDRGKISTFPVRTKDF